MEQELILLSGIQHFAFCPRQWALIHIEQQWLENERTADGNIFHERAHNGPEHELRGDTLTIRGLHVTSQALGVSGICDVVEFHRCPEGIHLHAFEGLWMELPAEMCYCDGSNTELPMMNPDVSQSPAI